MANPVQKDVTRLASEMVRIPSVTGNEGAMSEHVAGVLKSLDMTVQVDEAAQGRKNVVGRLDGSGKGPTLIFNCHMDVVPVGEPSKWTKEPFGGVVSDGRLYGRGAADMKGGLAATLAAVARLADKGTRLRGNLVVEAVVDEEAGGLSGTRRLTADKPVKGDYVIIPEPTNLELATAHKGDLGVEVVVEGRSAHAATPEVGVNAVHKSIHLANRLLEMPARFNWPGRTHELLGPPSISISVINGGMQRNIIPDRCTMVIDRRVVPPFEDVAAARQEISDVLKEARDEDPQLTVSTKSLIEVEGMVTEKDEEIVRATSEAYSETVGSPPKLVGLRGFFDGHFFQEHLGIPAVAFGPGSLEQAHTVDEYVEIEQLEVCTDVFQRLISRLLA